MNGNVELWIKVEKKKNIDMLLLYKVNYIYNNFKNLVLGAIRVTERSVEINIKKKGLLDFVYFLKISSILSINSLIDLFAIDFLGKALKYRYVVNYIFFSRLYGFSLNLKVYVNSFESVLSLNFLYDSSVWLEREVWDMFGIFFFKNKDMRRILTDYGFEGFPLRKDFPVVGFYELKYSLEQRTIISFPTKLNQAFRLFQRSSVWNFKK